MASQFEGEVPFIDEDIEMTPTPTKTKKKAEVLKSEDTNESVSPDRELVD